MAKNWEEYLKENIDSQRTPQWKQYIADHIPPARAGEFDPLAGENGMFNLPEPMKVSARRSPAPVPVDGDFDPLVSEAGEGLVIPFVDAIAQAAMRNAPQAVRPTRRVNAMDAITTAADTGFEDFTPEQINTPVNMPALVQDAAATAMAIPYTAASTGVSTANFLTGGMLDDAVLAMNEGERALRQSFGSNELNRQVEAVNAVQQDADSNLFDVLVAAANNPRSLAYDAIRNFGTMALPTGAALGAGKLAQAAPALTRYVPALERVAPWMANNAGKIGTGASMAANALMNASDTFADEDMMKRSLGERYAGAGISALISLLTGVATEGGAEGQIARRLLNGRQEAAGGALNYLKGLGKSAFKEGLQEYGEESGNYLGKVFGTNGLADFNEMNKQAGYASLLGSLTGGVSHVGTNLGGQRQQAAEPLSAIEREIDRRMAVDALRPDNAQLYAENIPRSPKPKQPVQADFLSQVMTELEKIRQQNEQQVQARQVQGQYVEPQDVRWNEMPQQEQPAVQASQEAQVSQGSQRGKDETLESLDGQRPADSMPDNPLDIIIANGGIKPEVLKKDLGWTDEEIAKLPQGVVTDDGKTLLPLRRALKKAGLDTDVNAILDAASRPEAPEMDFAQEEAQLLAQQNGQPVADTRQEKANSPEKMSNRLFEPESVVRQPAEKIKSTHPENRLVNPKNPETSPGNSEELPEAGKSTVSKEENVQPGKDKKQGAKNINPVPQQYFTAKDGSFVAFIDHSGNKPMMTAVGRNGQTKGIVVGKTVSQMVQDGRLIRSSREDIGKWLNDKGLEWPSENVLPQSDSVGAEVKNEFPLRDAKRLTGEAPGIHSDQPTKGREENKVRGDLPTGGTEYLTGAVPGQQTSQLAKEGQPDAAENNVSRSGVKGQEETDPPQERAPSSHSVAGTPRAETSVNGNPSFEPVRYAEERAEAKRQYDQIEKKYKGTPLWMKAPNGEPTKLTERQWVQVRTPNFKRWFGDWEKAGIRERLEGQEPVPVEAKYRTGSEKERRNIAKSLKIDFIAETDIGSVIVNNSSIKDSLQHGNTDKKLDVLEDLKNIIESSTFLDAVEDFDGKGHRNYYLATRIDRSGSKEIVFFRVRKTAGRDQRLYVHDVFLEEEIKGNPVSALDESRQGAEGNKSNGHPRGPDLYRSILQDIYATDNESISKVVDSNGEPKASDVKAFTDDPKSEPVKYSRKEQQDKGMSVDELRLLADTLVESFHNAPGIVVADRPQDAIPNALPDGMGLFDPNNGKVFLFARNIRDADTARAVFAHEVIAHYGLRGFFGDSLGDVLVSIRNHNPKIERLSQEWWSENQDYIKQVRENEGRNWTEEQFEKWQRDISIEEAMAFFAEQGEKITGVKRLVRKIQELLRDITRRLGWRWPANLANWLESKTDAEALSALHQAGLFVRGEISGQTTTTQSDIEKYRVSDDGSQHDGPVAFSRKNAFSKEETNRPDSVIADRIRQAMKKVGEETVNTRRNIEDKYIDLKLLQRAIEETGGVIPERQDAYLHVRQYVRRTSDQLKRFQNNGVKPIVNALNESGVTLEEANDWLYARHVWLDRVNDRLKNLPANRDKPNNEALSGMSDADAKAILKKHAGNEKLQELGKLVDRMTKFTRSRMVDGQLVPKGMVELWEKTYSHYVPLMRDEEKGGIRKSRGFVVRGQESKQRTGSERRAVNILENIFAQAESTIIRAEKAEAARALYRLAKANPNPDLWKVRKNKVTLKINEETGLMEWEVDKLHREKDHVLIVKLNGEEHLIEFNENNPSAVEIAKALKNLDAPQIPKVISLAGEGTRYIGKWLTTRNILFASRNFLRDVQHALFNLSDTPISGKEGQVLKNLPQAAIGYIHAMRGKESDDKYTSYAHEFMEAGGETGFIRSMTSIDDYRADLERQIKEMNQENVDPRKWWRLTWEAVENANNVIENSTRLAVYIVARENGISIRKAAMIAGEITVDFNKRGKWSGWMNSLWMFSNANIQGHARMLAALKHSKKARILAASLVGAGFVMSFAARAMLGKDDETGQDVWDEISDFDKERNWIIPIPWKGGKEPFVRVPMAQGLHVLPNVGRALEEMIFSSKKLNPIEKMLRLALLTVDAFNPFGAAGSLGQFIAPSAAKPIIQIAENKSFTGLPLHRGDAPFGGYNAPAYSKAYRNTPKHWTAMSKWLNNITGGDDVSSGHVDIAPETLRLAITSYLMPGVSSQIVDPVFSLATKALGDEAISVKDIPGLSSFVGLAPDERAKERAVYDRLSDLRNDINVIKEYRKQGRLKEAREGVKELGNGDFENGLRIFKGYDAFTNRLQEINRAKRIAEKKNNEVALRNIEAARKRFFTDFLRRKM